MTSAVIPAAGAGTWQLGELVEENLRQLGRDHLAENVAAADLRLGPDDLALLDQALPLRAGLVSTCAGPGIPVE